MSGVLDASSSAAWAALLSLGRLTRDRGFSDWVGSDNDRAAWAIVDAVGITLDLTRQRANRDVIDLLVRLADEVRLRPRIEAMYRGDVINSTEGRAVLHTALRRSRAPFADEVRSERNRMLAFAEAVRMGRIGGSSGRRFDLVVNIGIGGSDLGPAMAVEALRPFTVPTPRLTFISNVDGTRLADLLSTADPERTLFIVCSKTFTTLETQSNARVARAWIVSRLGESAVPAHFAAVSVNTTAMDDFGVHPEHRFALWDWVGGRYSLWSSIGVSIAIAIGAKGFSQLLAGAADMDEHFLTAPWRQNLPALLGLLGVWNINALGLPTVAVLPYSDRLARFPAYLQQLEMESNGKGVRIDGTPVFCATAPVIWGEPGNNAQHSFFQMLHQGTPAAALDFLIPVSAEVGRERSQELTLANALAQAEAFAWGRAAAAIDGAASLVPHKTHAGNRPSTLIVFNTIDPFVLGSLIALYEHKVFVQSVIWGINAFDQWGVELGKKLAQEIVPMLDGSCVAGTPTLASTLDVIRRYRS